MRQRSTASIVAFGGSVTWGSRLDNPNNGTFADLLAAKLVQSGLVTRTRVRNMAIRSHGTALPALCCDDMLNEPPESCGFGGCEHAAPMGERAAEPADIVVAEFAINGEAELDVLLRKLRRRYPDALLLYYQHVALWSRIESDGEPGKPEMGSKKPWTWSAVWSRLERHPEECPLTHPYGNSLSQGMVGWLSDTSTLLFSLQYALRHLTTPNHAVALFSFDLHHLSARGHEFVAEGLWSTIRHAAGWRGNSSTAVSASAQCDASRPGRFERTDRYGSTCYVWFGTGVVDARLKVAAGVGDEMWAMGLIQSSGTKYAFMLTPRAVATRSEATLALHFRAKAGAAVQIAFMQGENGGRYSHAMASVTYLGEHPHEARGGSNATLSGLFDGSPKSEAKVPVHILVIERLNGRLQHDGWHRLDVQVVAAGPVASLKREHQFAFCGFALDHTPTAVPSPPAPPPPSPPIVPISCEGEELCGAKCNPEVWCSSVDDAKRCDNAYVLRKRTNLYSRCFFEGGKCHLSLAQGHCTQNGNSWVKH